MLYTGPAKKKMTASIKLTVKVSFWDNGISNLNDQAAEAFFEGEYSDPEIYDITDIEEEKE